MPPSPVSPSPLPKSTPSSPHFMQSSAAIPTLAPIFAAHVSDWPAHEAKIALFLAQCHSVERGYDGNPMAVHKAAGNVHPGMFDSGSACLIPSLTRELAARQRPPHGRRLPTASAAACAMA